MRRESSGRTDLGPPRSNGYEHLMSSHAHRAMNAAEVGLGPAPERPPTAFKRCAQLAGRIIGLSPEVTEAPVAEDLNG